MATITAAYIDEQIGYLRTDHSFYIVYDEEFGDDEADLPKLRRLLRRAATTAGMRVHTRVYEDDAVWVYDPGWNPIVPHRDVRLSARDGAGAVQLLMRFRLRWVTRGPGSHRGVDGS